MKDRLISIQRAGINDELVQINFGNGSEQLSSLPLIEQAFLNCFKNKDYQIIVNMVNIKFPSTKFIAVLIEASNVARRLGGYVKLINVSNSAQSNFMAFSATTYLSIESSEKYALYDFDKKLAQAVTKKKRIKNKDFASTSIKSKDNADLLKEKELKSEISQKLDILNISNVLKEDTIKIGSSKDSLYEVTDFVTDMAKKAGFDVREIAKIKVTIYEACLNVIEHAYFSNPEFWIEVTVSYNKKKFIIIINDWGEGFEFDPRKKAYDVEQAVKDRKTGGFGMYIMQRSVDEMHYESDTKLGNRLILVKYIK